MKRDIEAETILQPSLHTISEYVDMVLGEAEFRGIDVANLRADYDSDPDGEFINEIADDALAAIADAGYPCVEQDDTLLIFPKGSTIPEEWQE